MRTRPAHNNLEPLDVSNQKKTGRASLMDKRAGNGTFSPVCSRRGLKLLQGTGMGTNIGNLGWMGAVHAWLLRCCQLARLETSMNSLKTWEFRGDGPVLKDCRCKYSKRTPEEMSNFCQLSSLSQLLF